MPKRIQRKRSAGWRMPEGAVYVGRPTKWGNPYRVDGAWIEGPGHMSYPTDRKGIHEKVVGLFEKRLRDGGLAVSVDDVRRELRGKDLVCWCRLYDANGSRVRCHADVLLQIANDIMLDEVIKK